MAREFVAMNRNERPVYLDHAATNMALHLEEAPDLLDLVKEVVADAVLAGENVAIETDMGRIVGETSMVETTEADEIIYAKRRGRERFTRFVLHRALEPTPYVSVILHRMDDGYRLWSAWCGQLLPKQDPAVPKGQGFWRNHALVFDESIVDPATITRECPWA